MRSRRELPEAEKPNVLPRPTHVAPEMQADTGHLAGSTLRGDHGQGLPRLRRPDPALNRHMRPKSCAILIGKPWQPLASEVIPQCRELRGPEKHREAAADFARLARTHCD